MAALGFTQIYLAHEYAPNARGLGGGGAPHLSSLHSWAGAVLLVLLVVQAAVGFVILTNREIVPQGALGTVLATQAQGGGTNSRGTLPA